MGCCGPCVPTYAHGGLIARGAPAGPLKQGNFLPKNRVFYRIWHRVPISDRQRWHSGAKKQKFFLRGATFRRIFDPRPPPGSVFRRFRTHFPDPLTIVREEGTPSGVPGSK